METFLRQWLDWPSIVEFMSLPWAWPLSETFHYFGLCLLLGAIGMFDLRVLGFAKGLPMSKLKQVIPWGVFGFILCVITGMLFVLGFAANLPDDNAYDVIVRDGFLQLKLIAILLAGLNLGAFYLTGAARAVDQLGPNDEAPAKAKIMAGASLVLWTSVIALGRMIPEGL